MPRYLLILLLSLSTPLAAAPVDFTLPDLDGRPLHLSDYRGKWVVANFWATWCSPCREEMPELAAFQAQNEDWLQTLGINFEEDGTAQAREFLASIGGTGFPHVRYDGSDDGLPPDFFVDRDGNQLSLQGLPSTFFIDPKGEVRGMHLGPLDRATLTETLERLRRSPE